MVILKYATGSKKNQIAHAFASRNDFVSFVYAIMLALGEADGLEPEQVRKKYGFEYVGETNGHKQYTNPNGFITCLHYLMDNNSNFYVELR